MTISDFLAIRLLNQRLAYSGFTAPDQVVDWFGAVQAQELSGALYAIGLRIPGSTEADVVAALENKTIVRAWPMRSTIHFLPAKDAYWITSLLSPRQNRKAASIYRNLGLSEEIFLKARPILEKALADGPVTRKVIYEALEADRIDTDNGRGLHIIRYWAQEALLCFGPPDGKQPTLALFEAWIPHRNYFNEEEGLAIIAERYFQSHGPATVQDFMWWAGCTKAEAVRAIAAIAHKFIQTEFDGKTYILSPPPEAVTLQHQTFLLPAFDEYTVAYADRSAVMGTSDTKKMAYGLGPNIVINGRAVGTWKRTLQNKAVLIELTPFSELTAAELAGAQGSANEYARFIGAEATVR